MLDIKRLSIFDYQFSIIVILLNSKVSNQVYADITTTSYIFD